MIELASNRLKFQFDEVLPGAHFTLDLQRTLRIPDDNRDYPLPPGLGTFPLLHVDDFADALPASWSTHGGVLLPMHRSEAMWLNFTARDTRCAARRLAEMSRGIARLLSEHHASSSDLHLPALPCAIKVAAGKINAITGEPWSEGLSRSPQDYAVSTLQPWLDGFCVANGLVRQFVAMPLGEGYTAEEQITGTAEFGGLQVAVYPLRRERYAEMVEAHVASLVRARSDMTLEWTALASRTRRASVATPECADLGLAPGGLMRQRIHRDHFDLDDWDTSLGRRCFIHLMDAQAFASATGRRPPSRPPTAREYSDAGLPWFEHYRDAPGLNALPVLSGLDSVAARQVKVGAGVLPDNESVTPPRVLPIHGAPGAVRQGSF